MPLIDMPMDELKSYGGRNPRPDHFDAYWAAGLAELDQTDPDITLAPATILSKSAECFHLTFTGVGGARVYAKYLRPIGLTAPGPAVLMFHGYTANSGDWSDKLAYVSQGFTVLAMDCRGQGGQSTDPGGVSGNTLSGHIIRGLADAPERLYFRNVYLDTVQLARIAGQLPNVDANRIGALGGSQGGGLTLACAALHPAIRKAAPTYPFLCDFQRVWEMDLAKGAYEELATFFRRFDPRHERINQWFERLGYIDCQHLASRIQADVLMPIGLMDAICPPSTQMAAFNRITSRKELLVYPDFGHEHLPQASDIVFNFMADL
jgi:cephalosporin-C deacetylase